MKLLAKNFGLFVSQRYGFAALQGRCQRMTLLLLKLEQQQVEGELTDEDEAQ